MSNTLDLTKELISRKSVTPEDAGCQELIAERLSKIGFKIENLQYGEVKNLWATIGNSGPLFVFLGHTDDLKKQIADQNYKSKPINF